MTDRILEVAFPEARDLPGWERRFDAGEVPSRWPYGLDALARPGVVLRHRGVRAPSRLTLAARTIVRPRRSPELVRVAWDENAANQITGLRPAARQFTGVIWLTDRVALRGPAQYARLIGRLRRFDGLWVLSRAQVDPLCEVLGGDGPPVRFVRFGVDGDFFEPSPYPEHPMVLSVGGDRDRDSPTMFRALSLVHDAVPDAKLLLQTTSTDMPPPGIEVVPHLPHRRLAELYREASVVTVATRQNLHVSGMTVSLEAMASARPVVVTGSPGFDDYVADGVDSLIAPSGDAEALAGRIIALLRDPDRARAMGRNGREAVEQRMTTRHLADALADFVLEHP